MNGSPPASFTSCVTHGNRDRLVTTTIAATDLQSRQSRSLPVNSRKLQPAVDPGPREEKQTYYSCLAAPTFFLSSPPLLSSFPFSFFFLFFFLSRRSNVVDGAQFQTDSLQRTGSFFRSFFIFLLSLFFSLSEKICYLGVISER